MIISCNPNRYIVCVKNHFSLDFKASGLHFCEIWILILHVGDYNMKFKI
jgi:hypothetical protein